MQNFIILVALSFLFLSCKKETPIRQRPHWGEVSAMVNGESWSNFMKYESAQETWPIKIYGYEGSDRSDHPCNLSTFSIMMHKLNPSGFDREWLVFAKIPARKGIYIPEGKPGSCDIDTLPSASYGTSQDDGDALKDVYELVQSENNHITITSFDPVSEEIKGSYQLTFVIQSKSAWPPDYPDTVRFSRGEFHTKIIQKREP